MKIALANNWCVSQLETGPNNTGVEIGLFIRSLMCLTCGAGRQPPISFGLDKFQQTANHVEHLAPTSFFRLKVFLETVKIIRFEVRPVSVNVGRSVQGTVGCPINIRSLLKTGHFNEAAKLTIHRVLC